MSANVAVPQTLFIRMQRCAGAGEFSAERASLSPLDEVERTLKPAGLVVCTLHVALFLQLMISPILYFAGIAYVDQPSVECLLIVIALVLVPAPRRCCRRRQPAVCVEHLSPRELARSSLIRVTSVMMPFVVIYFGSASARSFYFAAVATDDSSTTMLGWGVAWTVAGLAALPIVTLWGTLARFAVHAQGVHSEAHAALKSSQHLLDPTKNAAAAAADEQLDPETKNAAAHATLQLVESYHIAFHYVGTFANGHARAIQTRVIVEGLTLYIFSLWLTFESWGCRMINWETRLDYATPVECAMIKQANWATAAHLATAWILRLSLAMVRLRPSQGNKNDDDDDGGIEDGSWVRLLQRKTFLEQCFYSQMTLFVSILRGLQIILLIFTSLLVLGLYTSREAEERFSMGSSNVFADDAAVGMILLCDGVIFLIDAVVLCSTTTNTCAPRHHDDEDDDEVTRRD